EHAPLRQAGLLHRVLDAAADHVEAPLEGQVILSQDVHAAILPADEELLYDRLAGLRGRPDLRVVGRDGTPAEDDLALLADDVLEQLLAVSPVGRVGRPKDRAD